MIRIIKMFLMGLFFTMALTACDKEYSTESGGLPGSGATGGSQSGTAVYALNGAPGACVTPIIGGNFVAGTALNASNTVIITVNVATVGTYVISTGTANGISFSGSGTFTITGNQIIVLTGSGTPSAAGTNVFSPGTNGCSFSITTTTSGTSGTAFIKCKIDGVDRTFNFLASATRSFGGASGSIFSAIGSVSAGSTEAIELGLTGLDFPPGTYEEEGVVPTAIAFADGYYIGPGLPGGLWQTGNNPVVPNPHPFKIVITSISTTRVTGTFEGGMYDTSSSTEKVFTAGSFDLPMQ